MKKHFLILLLFLSMFTLSFAESNTPDLITWVKGLRLRENPNLDSKVIKTLTENQKLIYLSKKTETKQTIKLRGYDISDVWIMVETKDGDKGWVFKGATTKIIKTSGLQIYAANGILYIYSEKKNKLILQKNFDMQGFPYVHDVAIKKVNNYLIMQGIPPWDPEYFFHILYDIKSNEILFENLGDNYIGLSPSKEYIAFYSASIETQSHLEIYSLKSKKSVYKKTLYKFNSDEWATKGKIYLEILRGKKINGKPDLGVFEDYIEKAYWDNGKLIKTNIIEKRHTEY